MLKEIIKKPVFIIPTIITLIIVGYCSFRYNNKVVLNENEWIRLDSIRLLSRAYTLTSKGTVSGYEFQGLNGANFGISEPEFSALIDPEFLYNKLQYSSTIVTVFTTRKGKKEFDKGFSIASRHVPVRQLIIDNKKYIDTTQFAPLNRKRFFTLIGFTLISYLIFVIITINDIKSKTQIT